MAALAFCAALAVGGAGYLVSIHLVDHGAASAQPLVITVLGTTTVDGETQVITTTRTVAEPGATSFTTLTADGRTVIVRGPGETVTEPGATVRRPGETVVETETTPGRTRIVTTPGRTRVVTTPGGTRTVTDERTVTEPSRTVTDERTMTEERTVTDTVTREVTDTVTEEITVTQTQTETETVTETVGRPPKP